MEPENSQETKVNKAHERPMIFEDAMPSGKSMPPPTGLMNYSESPAGGSVDKSMDLDDFNQSPGEKMHQMQSNNQDATMLNGMYSSVRSALARTSELSEEMHMDAANAAKAYASTDAGKKSFGAQALNLIYYNSASKQYLVSDEARSFLSSIDEKVAVIAVAGKYRTGKSFLLNRVILDKRDSGFGVGPTINPCTKGLWVWSEPLETVRPDGEKLKVLVVDSEGIGAFDEDVNHDTKIFLLALLLSSNFIFNSMNTIDENAINSLSLIINLSKELQVKQSEMLGETDPTEIQQYFPSFLWVVRDFSLRLIDTYGNTINQKQYLENALQPQKGNSDAVEQKNRIRRMIQLFFKDRDCCTLVRPVENERALQNLQAMDDGEFRPEFLQQITTLRQRILKRTKPKMLNGKHLSGAMLLELCIAYTEAINKGSVPNIQSAWSYVCQNECQRTITQCISKYLELMREPHQAAKQTLDGASLKSANRSITETCVNTFRKEAMSGQDGEEMMKELELKLRDQLREKYQDMKRDVLNLCRQQARKYLDDKTQPIRRQLQAGAFESIDEVTDALNNMRSQYDGPKFNGFETLISDVYCQLLQKSCDYFTINQQKDNKMEKFRLEERLKELEAQLKQTREDSRRDKDALQNRVASLLNENSDLVKSERLMEERGKREIEELKTQLIRKQNELKEDKILQQSEIQSVRHQLEILSMQRRQDETAHDKKYQELQKVNALIEQKLALTEKDRDEQKSKLADKDKDMRELQNEHYLVRVEVQELKQKLIKADGEKLDAVQKMENAKDREIAKLRTEMEEQAVSAGGGQAWVKEREQLTKQVETFSTQYEQSIKLQESLLAALNRQNERNDDAAETGSNTASVAASQRKNAEVDELTAKNAQLLEMNGNLTSQIVQMQKKQQELEDEIKALKKFKRVVVASTAFQCKYCLNNFSKDQLIDHIEDCMANADRDRASILLPPSGSALTRPYTGGERMRGSMLVPGAPAGSVLTPQFVGHTIEIQACAIAEAHSLRMLKQSNYRQVVYTIVVMAGTQDFDLPSEWVLSKTLADILGLQSAIKAAYSSFDFQGHGLMLVVNPPAEADDAGELSQGVLFYFSSVLQYEIQQLVDKLLRIPFIRDGQLFKDFFRIQQQRPMPALRPASSAAQMHAPVVDSQVSVAQIGMTSLQHTTAPAKSGVSPPPFDRSESLKKNQSEAKNRPPYSLELGKLEERSVFSHKAREHQRKSSDYTRPVSNRYCRDDDEDEDDLDVQINAQLHTERRGHYGRPSRVNKQVDTLGTGNRDLDSSEVLCWTRDKQDLGVQQSGNPRIFKSNDRSQPGALAKFLTTQGDAATEDGLENVVRVSRHSNELGRQGSQAHHPQTARQYFREVASELDPQNEAYDMIGGHSSSRVTRAERRAAAPLKTIVQASPAHTVVRQSLMQAAYGSCTRNNGSPSVPRAPGESNEKLTVYTATFDDATADQILGGPESAQQTLTKALSIKPVKMAEDENVASSAGDQDNDVDNSPYDRDAGQQAYQNYMDGQVQPPTLHQQSAEALAQRASRNDLATSGVAAMHDVGLDETQVITFNDAALREGQRDPASVVNGQHQKLSGVHQAAPANGLIQKGRAAASGYSGHAAAFSAEKVNSNRSTGNPPQALSSGRQTGAPTKQNSRNASSGGAGTGFTGSSKASAGAKNSGAGSSGLRMAQARSGGATSTSSKKQSQGLPSGQKISSTQQAAPLKQRKTSKMGATPVTPYEPVLGSDVGGSSVKRSSQQPILVSHSVKHMQSASRSAKLGSPVLSQRAPLGTPQQSSNKSTMQATGTMPKQTKF